MLWVLKRTISMRWFFCAPKTYAKHLGQENIHRFTLKIFVYVNDHRFTLKIFVYLNDIGLDKHKFSAE